MSSVNGKSPYSTPSSSAPSSSDSGGIKRVTFAEVPQDVTAPIVYSVQSRVSTPRISSKVTKSDHARQIHLSTGTALPSSSTTANLESSSVSRASSSPVISKSKRISQEILSPAVNPSSSAPAIVPMTSQMTSQKKVLVNKAAVAQQLAGENNPLHFMLLSMAKIGSDVDRESVGIVSPEVFLFTFAYLVSPEELFLSAYECLEKLESAKTSKATHDAGLVDQQVTILKFLDNVLKSDLYFSPASKSPRNKNVANVLQTLIIPFANKNASIAVNQFGKDLSTFLEVKVERSDKKLIKLNSVLMKKNVEETNFIILLTEILRLNDPEKMAQVAQDFAFDLRNFAADSLRAIPIEEFFTKKMETEESRQKAPHYADYCQQINFIERFVKHVILVENLGTTEVSLAAIHNRISFFTEAAKAALDLHDYQSAAAIYFALINTNIERFVRKDNVYKEGVPKKLRKSLEMLDVVFNMSSNYGHLKRTIQQASQENAPHIYPGFILSKEIEFSTIDEVSIAEQLNLLHKSLQNVLASRKSIKALDTKMTPRINLLETLTLFHLKVHSNSNHEDELDRTSEALKGKLLPSPKKS